MLEIYATLPPDLYLALGGKRPTECATRGLIYEVTLDRPVRIRLEALQRPVLDIMCEPSRVTASAQWLSREEISNVTPRKE
jgi:hypothetical protein